MGGGVFGLLQALYKNIQDLRAPNQRSGINIVNSDATVLIRGPQIQDVFVKLLQQSKYPATHLPCGWRGPKIFSQKFLHWVAG